jgi:hypothetical protein
MSYIIQKSAAMACSNNDLGPGTTFQSNCSIGTTHVKKKKTIVIEDTKFVGDYEFDIYSNLNPNEIVLYGCDFSPINRNKSGIPPPYRHDKKPIDELVNFLNKIPSIKTVVFSYCGGLSDIGLFATLIYVKDFKFRDCSDLKDISKLNQNLIIKDCKYITEFTSLLEKKQNKFIRFIFNKFYRIDKLDPTNIHDLINLKEKLLITEDTEEKLNFISQFIKNIASYYKDYRKYYFNDLVFLNKMYKYISKQSLDFSNIIFKINEIQPIFLKRYSEMYSYFDSDSDDGYSRDDYQCDDYPSDDYPSDDYSDSDDYNEDELLVDPGCESDPGYIAHKRKYRIPPPFHY